MPELTTDELTILDLAARGQSMMPIGRWEKPVEHLIDLGYLRALDKFNTFITDEGKAAHVQQFDLVDTRLAQALIANHNVQVHYRDKANRLVQDLVALVREASEATGDPPEKALQRVIAEMRNSALELLS